MTFNSISGIVRDEANQEVANATVALIKQNGGSIVEYTQTDSNGFYEFFFHPEANATEENWHVAVYDDTIPIFNSFSKPYVSAALNLGRGSIGATASLGGTGTIINALGVFGGASAFTGARDIADAAVFGDGSDGNVSPATGTQTSDVLFTENYTIGSGVTRTVEGTLIVHAQDTIQIDGTLEAVSTLPGGDGGPTTSGSGIPGDNGPNGVYIPGNGTGGAGGNPGDADPGNFAGGGGGGGQGAFNGGDPGGDGGDGGGATGTIPPETTTGTVGGDALLSTRSGWDELFTLPSDAGAGGGGGGSGGEDEGGARDGQFGGDGGRGGGIIILVAPNITGTGTVSTAGENGQNGKESSSVGQGGDQPGAGGGGGGGSGGLLYTVGDNNVGSGLNLDVSGGAGGIGGEADSNGHTGGDGANGRDGELYTVTLS